MSRQCVIQWFNEFPALITTYCAGLVYLDAHLNIPKNQTALGAKGVI